jgi:hypothetical protein
MTAKKRSARQDPTERTRMLQELEREFDRGGFPVELWRVRQLLERHSDSPRRIRSRKAARVPYLRLLEQLEIEELSAVHQEMVLRRSGKSDLDIIADAILRRTG